LHLHIPGLIGPKEKYESFGTWTKEHIDAVESQSEKMQKDILVMQRKAKDDSSKKEK